MLEHDSDYSLPLATLLREATKTAHEEAETSRGAKLLLSGKLPRERYIQFLMMLWHVYDAFERALEQHALHPVLEPTYNPTLLARATALSADIAHLLQVPSTSWKTHPLYLELISSTTPTSQSGSVSENPLQAYTSRITYLASLPNPAPLLAHSYVRYLGDLSGGQFIRRTIAKAYGLDEAIELGTEFYMFGPPGKRMGQGDMKRLKEWFRDGMNKGAETGKDEEEVRETKAAIVGEANLAFMLNMGLFSLLEEQEEKEEVVLHEPPLTTSALPTKDSDSQKTYSVASVVALIAAVSLTHFILVVGGFTSGKGLQKLLAFGQWFNALFTGTTVEN